MTNKPISEVIAEIKAAANIASTGPWIKESGDGWDAVCSADDQANSGFIIAHLEGPDSDVNRKFVQATNPVNVKRLIDRIAALEQQLGRYSMSAGQADQRMAESRHARQELGFGVDAEDVSPSDLVAAIAEIRQQLAAERAISSALRESMAAIHNTIRMDGISTSLGALLSASKAAYDKSRLPVEGE
ncbi:hypothetical protein [Pectobacterium carotovorum]|uniref:hypothetical protein n=1 Tax=Pectobacterium carotovorum TaxID=554 RepID=UPI000D732101|nr:hypothetical protein [Pectobacterium carotovorum]PXB01170.1 hypothetical protein DMB41_16375 [Pectobacterium carotovorum subsp. carotovorum]